MQRIACTLFVSLLVVGIPSRGAEAASDASAGGGGAAPAPALGHDGAGALPPGLDPADWQVLRSTVEADRHAVSAAPEGHQAHNSRQQLSIRFDGRGVSVQPHDGDWAWGLQLECWGAPGAEQAVGERALATTEGARLAYSWDNRLTEWYVNDARGLEHGYTVHAPPTAPDATSGPEASRAAPARLQFTLSVRGDLAPVPHADGRGVRFVDTHGVTALTYSGLLVTDARGLGLAAHFALAGERLVLQVETTDAAYPITIDPIVQQAYIKASNTGAADNFGIAVAVSGDTAVVGAQGESSDATDVDGDQASDEAPSSGAAYIYVRNGATWSQQAYLKATNTGNFDQFGSAVAISGDTVLVGAPREGSMATGVGGDPLDNSLFEAGAAYVYVRSGTTWSPQAYLKASNTGASDHFGASVAVSGDTLIVGAPHEDRDAGAAYMFVRTGSSWSQQAYVKASVADAGDNFGASVALDGDTAVVGANKEDSNATGVDGDDTNNSAFSSGAAYVFVRSGSTWSQQAYLKASNTDASDEFGSSVALSGDTAIIGAIFEDGASAGVGGDPASNTIPNSGAAYVFGRVGTTWSQQAYLKPAHTNPHDLFGSAVAASGERVLVGSAGEDGSSTGVNGPHDNLTLAAGAAYSFVRDGGGSWTYEAYLKSSNPSIFDGFGNAVALSGTVAVVGADSEDSAATGIDGDGSDNGSPHSGAAYAFDFFASSWVDLGGGTSGIAGQPLQTGSGPLTESSLNTISLTNAPPAAAMLCWISFTTSPFAAMGGTVYAYPYNVQLFMHANGAGAFSGSAPWPASVPSATHIWFQFVVQDASSIHGLTLSNAVRATTP